jgi:hypothetical protein
MLCVLSGNFACLTHMLLFLTINITVLPHHFAILTRYGLIFSELRTGFVNSCKEL